MRLKKPQTDDDALATLATHYAEKRAALDQATEDFELAKRLFMSALMETEGRKYENYTLVEGKREVTNWTAVEQELSEAQIKMVTVAKFDHRKVAAAVELGAIDPETITKNTTTQNIAPYIREGRSKE